MLINSTPATIMTDRSLTIAPMRAADSRCSSAVIESERHDALLPTVGGKPLEPAVALAEDGK